MQQRPKPTIQVDNFLNSSESKIKVVSLGSLRGEDIDQYVDAKPPIEEVVLK